MAASLSDQSLIGVDPTFINRVKQALITTCVQAQADALAATFTNRTRLQDARAKYATSIMNPGSINSFAGLFALQAAADASVISDATAAGTVVVSAGNAAAQAALVTDAHILNAVFAGFNTFLNPAD